ncbi:MAG: hypothetical protein U1E64_10250 [Sphingomonadaceae bacterium]
MALVILVATVVTMFNSLTARLDKIEQAAKSSIANDSQPTMADPVEIPTKQGDKVTVQPVAVNVTAKELACLKLADGLTKVSETDQVRISYKMDELACFK